MMSVPVRKVQACQDIGTLINIEGPDFVRHAYATLLHRKPDHSGRESAEAFLRRGGRKIDLVRSMVRSEEWRGLKDDLPGLAAMLRRRSLESVPILGWMLRPLLGLERVGSTARLERAIAFAVAQSSEVIAIRLLRIESLITTTQVSADGFSTIPDARNPSVRAREIMVALLARLS